MSAAETQAVLRDVFVVAMLALAGAVIVYSMVRRSTENAWNFQGNVLSRPYGPPDVVAAGLLLALLGMDLFAAPAGAGDGGGGPGVNMVNVDTLLLSLVSMLLLCGLVLAYLHVVRGLNPAEMFGLRQMSVKRALRFAVIALILTVILLALVTWALLEWFGESLPDTSQQDAIEAYEKGGSLLFRALLTFVAVITAPLTEELIFRGFLYGVVKRGTDRWFAAVFTALIFAVVHGHVGSAPQLFVLGLSLAICYELSGCLLVPIFMHAMFNAWNLLLVALAVMNAL
jgi:membrane protease YdiL (CAAX protease family)